MKGYILIILFSVQKVAVSGHKYYKQSTESAKATTKCESWKSNRQKHRLVSLRLASLYLPCLCNTEQLNDFLVESRDSATFGRRWLRWQKVRHYYATSACDSN